MARRISSLGGGLAIRADEPRRVHARWRRIAQGEGCSGRSSQVAGAEGDPPGAACTLADSTATPSRSRRSRRARSCSTKRDRDEGQRGDTEHRRRWRSGGGGVRRRGAQADAARVAGGGVQRGRGCRRTCESDCCAPAESASDRKSRQETASRSWRASRVRGTAGAAKCPIGAGATAALGGSRTRRNACGAAGDARRAAAHNARRKRTRTALTSVILDHGPSHGERDTGGSRGRRRAGSGAPLS